MPKVVRKKARHQLEAANFFNHGIIELVFQMLIKKLLNQV